MTRKILGKRDLYRYSGELSQIIGVKEYRLTGGRADGVRAVDVKNGTGLEFTVLPDRGLDLAWLSYKGINMSYMSKTGIVAPQYSDARGNEFLRSFHAGFLTTCGLTQVGTPCEDEGEELGLHGRISNLPAEELYAGTEWVDDRALVKVRGKLRQAKVFNENLVLTREISCEYGSKTISIHNAVENLGFRDEPLMLLYHFNLGYPLLDEHARLVLPTGDVMPRDREAAKGTENCCNFQAPTAGYQEQVFYHALKADDSGNTAAALINDHLGLGAVIRFNTRQLDMLTEWKQMGEGEYVLGIEPCNCFVAGRKAVRENGTLKFIKAGETLHFDLEVEVLEGNQEIADFEKSIADLGAAGGIQAVLFQNHFC